MSLSDARRSVTSPMASRRRSSTAPQFIPELPSGEVLAVPSVDGEVLAVPSVEAADTLIGSNSVVLDSQTEDVEALRLLALIICMVSVLQAASARRS
jgi:hypothetical protein